MRDFFFDHSTYADYVAAMRQYRRALRRGDLRRAQAWLGIGERCMRLQSRHDELVVSEEERNARFAERPHRLKALQLRAMYPT